MADGATIPAGGLERLLALASASCQVFLASLRLMGPGPVELFHCGSMLKLGRGEFLASERDLSSLTGFARETVRKALFELESRGWLRSRDASSSEAAKRIYTVVDAEVWLPSSSTASERERDLVVQDSRFVVQKLDHEPENLDHGAPSSNDALARGTCSSGSKSLVRVESVGAHAHVSAHARGERSPERGGLEAGAQACGPDAVPIAGRSGQKTKPRSGLTDAELMCGAERIIGFWDADSGLTAVWVREHFGKECAPLALSSLVPVGGVAEMTDEEVRAAARHLVPVLDECIPPELVPGMRQAAASHYKGQDWGIGIEILAWSRGAWMGPLHQSDYLCARGRYRRSYSPFTLRRLFSGHKGDRAHFVRALILGDYQDHEEEFLGRTPRSRQQAG